MNIWVDADACPVAVKEMLFRAAERRKVCVTLVANSKLRVPASAYIDMIQVGQGFDVADHEIVARLHAGDLVITSDIPLAADVLAKDAHALSVRGELFSSGTIQAKLSMRDFMDTMRASGVQTGGSAPLNQSDKQAFANQLDRLLTAHQKEQAAGGSHAS